MLYPIGSAAGGHASVIAPGLLIAGAGLLAAATVAGAWLASRRPGQRQIWLGAAAGALLVIAGMHVLPDAWLQARSAGLWPWVVPVVTIGTFLLAGVAARGGCACQRDRRHVGGTGAGAALGGPPLGGGLLHVSAVSVTA